MPEKQLDNPDFSEKLSRAGEKILTGLEEAFYEIASDTELELNEKLKNLSELNDKFFNASIDNLKTQINNSPSAKQKILIGKQILELKLLNTLYREYKDIRMTRSTNEKLSNLFTSIESEVKEKKEINDERINIYNIIENEKDKLEDNIIDSSYRDLIEESINMKGKYFEDINETKQVEDFYNVFTIEYINILERKNKLKEIPIEPNLENGLNINENELNIIVSKTIRKLNLVDKKLEFDEIAFKINGGTKVIKINKVIISMKKQVKKERVIIKQEELKQKIIEEKEKSKLESIDAYYNLTSLFNKLGYKLKYNDKEIINIKNKITSKGHNIEKLEKESISKEGEIQLLEKESISKKAKIQILEKENKKGDEIKKEIEELNENIESIKESIGVIKKNTEKIKKEIKNTKKDIIFLNTKLKNIDFVKEPLQKLTKLTEGYSSKELRGLFMGAENKEDNKVFKYGQFLELYKFSPLVEDTLDYGFKNHLIGKKVTIGGKKIEFTEDFVSKNKETILHNLKTYFGFMMAIESYGGDLNPKNNPSAHGPLQWVDGYSNGKLKNKGQQAFQTAKNRTKNYYKGWEKIEGQTKPLLLQYVEADNDKNLGKLILEDFTLEKQIALWFPDAIMRNGKALKYLMGIMVGNVWSAKKYYLEMHNGETVIKKTSKEKKNTVSKTTQKHINNFFPSFIQIK